MTPYRTLVEARGSDAFLTWEVEADEVQQVWADRDAAVWLSPSAYHGKPWLTGLGSGERVLPLLLAALDAPTTASTAGISVPPEAVVALPSRWRPRRMERWTWWWTDEQPSFPPDPAVAPLGPDDPRLPGLLQQSASVYLQPGDPRVHGWYGLVEAGRLLACLAVERHHHAVPHLASVVVDDSARRNGAGTRLCGTVVGGLLDGGAPAVSLAMMSANAPAAALYRRLGFQRGPSFASGTLPGRRNVPVEPGWPRRRGGGDQ